jgi:hypothetical protein
MGRVCGPVSHLDEIRVVRVTVTRVLNDPLCSNVEQSAEVPGDDLMPSQTPHHAANEIPVTSVGEESCKLTALAAKGIYALQRILPRNVSWIATGMQLGLVYRNCETRQP